MSAFLERAFLPQSRKTIGVSRALRRRMISSVISSHPLPLWELGCPGPHGEHGVEKEHAVLSPRHKTGRSVFNARLVADLLEDILKRRRSGHARFYGKAKPVRLPFPVVGVLPEDDRFHAFVRCVTQRVEDVVHVRIDGVTAVFLFEEFAQPQIVLGREDVRKKPVPGVADVDHTHIIAHARAMATIRRRKVARR